MVMEYRKLGRTDIDVSACCLGTMTWGTQNTQQDGFEQMDYALSEGVNFWDTAEMYSIPPTAESYGKTETIIGNWFAKTGRRQDVILATKVSGLSDMVYARDDKSLKFTRHTKEQIDEAVFKSLNRLQTDYIDLYQLHWPDRPVPLFGMKLSPDNYQRPFEAFEDILAHLNSHVQAGRIRHIGVSNETPWGVMRFLAEAEKHGLPRMQSIQNVYSLVSRRFEEGLDEIAAREQVGLLVYSPLAQGYLSGKYRDGALPQGSRKQLFDRMQRYEGPHGIEAIDAYLDYAAEIGWDPSHLALKFCDTRHFTTSTIIGATTMEQLKINIDAFSKVWTDEIEAAVNKLEAQFRSPAV